MSDATAPAATTSFVVSVRLTADTTQAVRFTVPLAATAEWDEDTAILTFVHEYADGNEYAIAVFTNVLVWYHELYASAAALS